MQKDSVEIRSIDGKLVLVGKCNGQTFRIFLAPESAKKLAADLISALPKSSRNDIADSTHQQIVIIDDPNFSFARKDDQVDLYISGDKPPLVKMTIQAKRLISFASDFSNELEALSIALRSKDN